MEESIADQCVTNNNSERDEAGSDELRSDQGKGFGGAVTDVFRINRGSNQKKNVYRKVNISGMVDNLRRKADNTFLDKGKGSIDYDTNPEEWNLEVEITKIIEEAAKADTNLQAVQGEENNQMWDVEVEVAKVIEIGVALSFDFNNKNNELVNEILKRELADVERFKAQGSLSCPWVLGGDFNTVLEPLERIGGPCSMSSLKSFNDFILKARVVDIPMQGSNFTWSNNRERSTWAKLDHFLLSLIFLSWFPKLTQQCLPRTISDHSAVAIGEPSLDWGPTPFRFFNHWMDDKERTTDAIKGFKAAKQRLKRWMAEKKNQVSVAAEIEKKLSEVEFKAVNEGWSESLRTERTSLTSKLWTQLRIEEQQWRQKSRVRWLKDGNKNSKFFHVMCQTKRRCNQIGELVINGVVCKDPPSIRGEIYRYFKEHYRQGFRNKPKLRAIDLKKLEKAESVALENEFSSEEVWMALRDYDGNKAPGPDGFNLNFIKQNWVSIKEDFLNFLKEFHRDGSIVSHLNRTFLALILKVGNPSALVDFRPISLVSSLYKLLAKILANRIKKSDE
ncbi:hypothetical protein Dsin_005599 [Dipteronia sinensis]|uniref:Uncharacterized protein n=1 Tax=Dipteronia sinensis TaxID=43782 RepID=A0AAE0AX55_9ROSI|nr:hypothetical protein Dsin_005599 [Dipteronia sinensis]